MQDDGDSLLVNMKEIVNTATKTIKSSSASSTSSASSSLSPSVNNNNNNININNHNARNRRRQGKQQQNNSMEVIIGNNPSDCNEQSSSQQMSQDQLVEQQQTPPATTTTTSQSRIPFKWSEYLLKHSSTAADEKLFPHILNQPKKYFEIGERLEGVDPHHESLFCVLHVVKRVGHRVRLRFDGYATAADFWCNTNSPFLFPMGWCNRNGVTLQPPKGIPPGKFEWESYLQKHKYQAASEDCFITANQKKNELNHEFRCGMKMEAIDRKNPAMICIATVADTLPNHILLHFDGWDDIYDQWVQPDSHLIFPTGSAKLLSQALALPQSLMRFLKDDEFSWEEYLQAFNAIAAPKSAFKKLSLSSSSPPPALLSSLTTTTTSSSSSSSIAPTNNNYNNSLHFIQIGQQIEAVDRRVPQLIRVATIFNIDHQRGVLSIHYNNWLDFYNIQCELDSPEIYPCGYCEKMSHPLEPPPDENYQPPYGDDGLCPIKGCRGIGHAKGHLYSSHQTAATCPYSELNFMKDCVQYERLEERLSSSSPRGPENESTSRRVSANGHGNGLSDYSHHHYQHHHSTASSSATKRKKCDESSSTVSSSLTTEVVPSVKKRNLRKSATMPSTAASCRTVNNLSNGNTNGTTTTTTINNFHHQNNKQSRKVENESNNTLVLSNGIKIKMESDEAMESFSENSTHHEQQSSQLTQLSSIINNNNQQHYSSVPPLLQPSLQTCIARSVLRPFDQEISSLFLGQRVHHKLVEELFPEEMWSNLKCCEPQSWSTNQVADFICNIVKLSPSQKDHMETLRKRIEEAEIDGESILLLQTGDFVNYFKLPLGITVKIMTLLSYMKS